MTIAAEPIPCDPATSMTRSLLGYGIIAGPFYVVVSLVQAFSRDGFDLTRHEWSLLANGRLGWIQTTNLILTGLMVLALAVGLRRSLRSVADRRGAVWAPGLVAAYGLGMVGAGLFRADPALGFPPGTAADAQDMSWPGLLHFVWAGLGFVALIAACLVLARRFAGAGQRGWAWFSGVTGILFVAGFAGIASGGGGVAMNLAFTAAILLVWAWLSALSVHLYRRPWM